MEESKKIILVSNDGVKKEISKKAAQKSLLIKNAIEDYQDNEEVPLTNVKGQILDKVIEYLNHYENEEPKQIKEPLEGEFKDCVDEWDCKFIDIELDLIFEIIIAANYMNIDSLLKLACARVAGHCSGKKTEELRKMFNIENDFTPEELKEIDEESKYCTEEL